MSLYDLVIAEVPTLAAEPNAFIDGRVTLQDDSDGTGPYIRAWNYSDPMTAALLPHYRGE